jgi:hypothetical protein
VESTVVMSTEQFVQMVRFLQQEFSTFTRDYWYPRGDRDRTKLRLPYLFIIGSITKILAPVNHPGISDIRQVSSLKQVCCHF